jgi:hypothetical protein
LFLDYLQKLFNTKLSKEKLYEFAVGHRFEGGLGLMLPGKYYDKFKEAQ